MLNVKDLELRYTKYKLKSYIPYALFIFSAIVVLILVDTFYNQKSVKKEEVKKEIKLKNIKKTPPKVQELVIIEKKEVITPKVKEIIKEKKIILNPSLNFMKRINSTVPLYTDETTKHKKPKHKVVPKVKTAPKVIEKKKQEPELKIEKKSNIEIKINKDNEDIQHVIKRFKINNNPALSLFVAKKYYKMGNYHKSYNYALITNQLNNNIEASWIIFAKSLMKLDKKDMALRTLKRYIDSSHSPRAKILLDEIQSGKFK